MKRNLHLLVIDPQNDFCDLPADYLPPPVGGHAALRPALPVPGAHADMLRVADLVRRGQDGLSAITITLDSHHRFDVAHSSFWMDAGRGPIAPFTQITAAQVRQGVYLPRKAGALPRVLAYLDALEAAGRYTLMAWPVHCEIGSWGHNVHADLRAAYNAWEDSALAMVGKISKGSNPWTEHYSAVQAEVPDADDESTQVNQDFLALLRGADQVYITGEAGSHCVRATTEHIVASWDQQKLSQLVLLTDCMSPVTGFTAQFDAFVRDMRARGLQIAQAADIVPELLANARR